MLLICVLSFLGGITRVQYERLKDQQDKYLVAKEKLEAQLLKLKEQREVLKEDGHVHEDKIMRENAKLQVIRAKIILERLDGVQMNDCFEIGALFHSTIR